MRKLSSANRTNVLKSLTMTFVRKWRIDMLDSFCGHVFAGALGIIAAYQPWKLYVDYHVQTHLMLALLDSIWSVQAICNAYVNYTEKKHLDTIKRKVLEMGASMNNSSFSRFYPLIFLSVALHAGSQISYGYTIIERCFHDNYYPLCVTDSIWEIYGFYRIFFTLIHYIWTDRIGQLFRKMAERIMETEASPPKSSSVLTHIYQYDVLIDASQKIHDYFRMHNFCITISSFGGLLITSFFTGVLYKDNTKIHDALTGMIHSLVPVALLIRVCTNCVEQAEKFNEALASLCIRDKTGTLVKNPYVTAHFAIGKKLKFSACGCFNIDYRLGYSMLAACITYLVILVEFDNKKDVVEAPISSTTPFPT